MPMYDYQCPDCHTQQVARRPIIWRDDMNPSCQNCGSPTTRNQALPAIVYKGPGFTKATEQPKDGE